MIWRRLFMKCILLSTRRTRFRGRLHLNQLLLPFENSDLVLFENAPPLVVVAILNAVHRLASWNAPRGVVTSPPEILFKTQRPARLPGLSIGCHLRD